MLELTSEGYEFPHSQHKLNDSNWLNIRLRLKVSEQLFERLDPALEATDLQRLSEWLLHCAEKHPHLADWDSTAPLSSVQRFLEPNLSVEVIWGGPIGIEGKCCLRFHLAAEFLPPFAKDLEHYSNGYRVASAWVDFACDAQDLRRVAAELAAEYAKFPTRVQPD